MTEALTTELPASTWSVEIPYGVPTHILSTSLYLQAIHLAGRQTYVCDTIQE